ncbi:hypothetical protein NUW54_g1632 [Trametes sanguinea]|uniref:Uncharacterized protein n=1 Tax=Trametes sanguinea TaxID=158606 RepID=A0ACC1Q6F4_9APHY|nr:hypothetical protein NUW54_g1632 [Trametes sanguinea]
MYLLQPLWIQIPLTTRRKATLVRRTLLHRRPARLVIFLTERMRTYLTAAQYHGAAEACTRTSELLRLRSVPHILQLYDPVMETTANGLYRRLLRNVEECSRAASPGLTVTLNVPNQHRRACIPVHSANGLGESTSCAYHYPATISTSTPPSWLSPLLTPVINALKGRARGSLLTVNGEIAKTFIGAVASDSPPCARPSGLSPGQRQCSVADNVWWACTFLESYARAVDRAIAQVRIVLDIQAFA